MRSPEVADQCLFRFFGTGRRGVTTAFGSPNAGKSSHKISHLADLFGKLLLAAALLGLGRCYRLPKAVTDDK